MKVKLRKKVNDTQIGDEKIEIKGKNREWDCISNLKNVLELLSLFFRPPLFESLFFQSLPRFL